MLAFNQSLDSYRPKNNIKHITQVDIVKTLEVYKFILLKDFYS